MKPTVISADARGISIACERLKMGGIIAYPTETFYALGACFDNEHALEKLLALKGSRGLNPFSLIIADKASLKDICTDINPSAERFIARYWPGPLTLVLNARAGLSEFVSPRGTVAVRVPGESTALELATQCRTPITATSANPTGQIPAVSVADVLRYFPVGLAMILQRVDSADAPGGLPSTIVDLTGDETKVLRAGAIDLDTDDLL